MWEVWFHARTHPIMKNDVDSASRQTEFGSFRRNGCCEKADFAGCAANVANRHHERQIDICVESKLNYGF